MRGSFRFPKLIYIVCDYVLTVRPLTIEILSASSQHTLTKLMISRSAWVSDSTAHKNSVSCTKISNLFFPAFSYLKLNVFIFAPKEKGQRELEECRDRKKHRFRSSFPASFELLFHRVVFQHVDIIYCQKRKVHKKVMFFRY